MGFSEKGFWLGDDHGLRSFKEIEELLHYFFNDVKEKVFGLSKGVSFYQFYQCAEPKIKLCREYLA